jgi:RsiW-degrading membrane proteinase PrsW (M82 family)
VPGWLDELQRLAQRLTVLQNNPQAIEQVLQGYLQNPLAIYGMLATLAFLVPLLEELLKPLAVWFLLGRQLSAAEGFVAGAVCGGAFTLLESLMTLSSSGQNDGWAALVVARAGTSLLHISTSALLGWALAHAWRSRSAGCSAYLRLLLAYLLAVSLHGIWNGLSIVFSVGIALATPPPALAWIARLAPAAPLALLGLVVGLFIFLWSSNRQLRKEQQKLI